MAILHTSALSLGAVCYESSMHGFEAEALSDMIRRPYVRHEAVLMDGFDPHIIVFCYNTSWLRGEWSSNFRSPAGNRIGQEARRWARLNIS